MALRTIVTIDQGNPVLREKSKRVREVTPAIRELMDDLVDTMRDAPGVGLAAPQVHVPVRVIAVEVPRDFDDPDAGTWLYMLANPEIARASDETEEGEEGCLSIPGLYGEVERATTVTVKALDRSNRKVRIRAEGFLARVLQHEIDHLDGVLFIDRITEPGKLWRLDADSEGNVKSIPVA